MHHSTTPYDHWVLDDFLPVELADAAYAHFFEGEGAWIQRHHLYSRYKATRTQGLHPDVEAALRHLESPIIVATLEKLTGLGPLSADPERFGGGQHVVYFRGKLGVHADFQLSPTGYKRVLNLLVYLNRRTGGGGDLELWSKDMKRCEVSIKPVFNRAVLFATSATSFHGHPDPMRWQQERRSLAAYYYTDRGPGEVLTTTTDYRPRPQDWALRLRRRLRILVKGR